MIIIPSRWLGVLIEAAERAYPEECCGLLIGRRLPDDLRTVTGVVASRNVARGRRQSAFAVDPRLRFGVSRALRESEDRLIGHYHSHPDAAAVPSAGDLAMAFEPELLWVIVAVANGVAVRVAAHQPQPDASRFRRHPVQIGGRVPPSVARDRERVEP
jgi:proteasome lid subunit RPN8/RPN11